jgi:LEA14-like dessication related protein
MNKFLNKKNIITIILIILILINIIVAILIFSDIQIIKSPETDIELKVIDISANDLTLEIKMKMHNPNSFEISIEDFNIKSIDNNGNIIGEIIIKGGIISSNNTETFIETDEINFEKNSDFKILHNKITGKIGVKFLGFIKKTIPIELNVITSLEEIIDNIEIPDINLEFGFKDLTKEGLEFTAGINIYNPNNIGLTINELTLNAINDNNEQVGNFKISGGEIKPKDRSNFTSNGVLLYSFIDTQKLILKLNGDASLKIAGMNKSISISTEMSVILPDIKDFIFKNESMIFYIPVQFKLTLQGIESTIGFKFYNPSNVTIITRNINCSIHRVDGDKKTQLGIKSMESCIINPQQEICIKSLILIPYIEYLNAGNWKLIPNWIVLTIEGDLAIAGTRQVFPISLNAFVNPNLFQNQEFSE